MKETKIAEEDIIRMINKLKVRVLIYSGIGMVGTFVCGYIIGKLS